MKNVLYIVNASWEDRFLLGARRVIPESGCTKALCFWFEDYTARTDEARKQFETEFKHLDPKFEKLRLLRPEGCPSVQAELWRRIFEVLAEQAAGIDSFVFDVTTTPRVALWIILDLLTEAKIPGTICYHQADRHGSWCGCEPDQPHVVPKLGGISGLDKPTKLLMLTGFDEDRSEHFINFFEPTETLILLQESFLKEAERNREPHLKRFRGRHGIRILTTNSYTPDWGYASLEKIAVEFGQGANLVLASVGPKPSAVSLYRLHRLMPHSSMVYSPCREYNIDYSAGIGDTMRLVWIPSELPAEPAFIQ